MVVLFIKTHYTCDVCFLNTGRNQIDMNTLELLLQNQILLSAVCGWLIAQVLKTLIHLYFNHSFVPERLVGSGGMPSAHSATVCALSTSAGIVCGVDSPIFAIATILAIVVMYDAIGVRRETGIQAKIINEMMDAFSKMNQQLSALGITQFIAIGAFLVGHEYFQSVVVPVEIAEMQGIAVP